MQYMMHEDYGIVRNKINHLYVSNIRLQTCLSKKYIKQVNRQMVSKIS